MIHKAYSPFSFKAEDGWSLDGVTLTLVVCAAAAPPVILQMLIQGGPHSTAAAEGGLPRMATGKGNEMSGSWSSGSEEDSIDEAEEQEEREEMSMLWSRTLQLVRASPPDFKSELMDTAIKRMGGEAPERLQQLMLPSASGKGPPGE